VVIVKIAYCELGILHYANYQEINDLFRLFVDLDIYGTFGIKRLGVLGSFARGEEFHDIDLFIEEDLGHKKITELKNTLESQTGIPFDVMVKKNAEPVILHRAMKDILYAI
jgi:predicted nucleotidyltransferase